MGLMADPQASVLADSWLSDYQGTIHGGMAGDHHPGAKGTLDQVFRQHALRIPIRGNAAIVQDDDPVSVLRGQVEVMQDRADRRTLLTTAITGSRQRGLLVAEVKAGCRLVQQQGWRRRGTGIALQLAEGAGELHAGALAERWSVRRAGVRVWDDALMLDALDDALLDRPALFAGARACATLVCACADPVKARDIARGALQGAANAGAGIVAGLMVTRLLDPDPARLRRDYARVWCALRAGLWDLPGRLPRLWHV